jgi:hypothetical protein
MIRLVPIVDAPEQPVRRDAMPCVSGNDHSIISGLEHGHRRDVAMLRLYHVPNNAIANNLVNQRNPGSDNCPIPALSITF